jgi:hypothetical protein
MSKPDAVTGRESGPAAAIAGLVHAVLEQDDLPLMLSAWATAVGRGLRVEPGAGRPEIEAAVRRAFGAAEDLRWGVFVRDAGDDGEWTERHRWTNGKLAALPDHEAAEVRAAETQDLHPEWEVEARQTAEPLPGTWAETHSAYLHDSPGKPDPNSSPETERRRP